MGTLGFSAVAKALIAAKHTIRWLAASSHSPWWLRPKAKPRYFDPMLEAHRGCRKTMGLQESSRFCDASSECFRLLYEWFEGVRPGEEAAYAWTYFTANPMHLAKGSGP